MDNCTPWIPPQYPHFCFTHDVFNSECLPYQSGVVVFALSEWCCCVCPIRVVLLCLPDNFI